MQIKDLTMSFGTQLLFEDINLNISEREINGVVGDLDQDLIMKNA